MSIRSSYSQNNTYKMCPQHWYWKYKEKYEPKKQGSSLYFGSAVDDAVTDLLLGKSNYLDKFYSRWKTADSFGKKIPVWDNPDVVYGYSDFDEYVLKEEDLKSLENWARELKLSSPGSPVTLYKEIVKKKKNPYKNLTENEQTYFNRAAWLSLKRKGEILIYSFKKDVYPKITKVLSTQKKGQVKNSRGYALTGFVDMVVELEGYDKPVIVDLKTSGQPYKQDKLDFTEQLAIYYAMEAKNYNTDLVGYIVLVKNIPKIKEMYCGECGYIKDGQHKTCNNTVNGERCKGEWIENYKLAPEPQIMVQQKSFEDIDGILADQENIMYAQEQGIIYKNFDKCTNWYGGVCPYFGPCHKNDFSDLIKKNKK